MTEPSRRARRPEAKDDRRRQIKDAARVLLDAGTPFDALTMADVLRGAGLAKGTGYLYFPTKEALFLDVLVDDLDAWFHALAEEVLALAGPTPEGIATTIADTLVARPRLLRLLSLLHAVLEQNLDVGSARTFKRFLAERLGAADALLQPRFPGFAPGDAGRFLLRAHALVVGLVGMASPSPVMAEVLAAPEMAPLRVDLREELTGSLAALLRGWRA